MQHHFVVVRPTEATRSGRILLMLATGTWTACNDWGGANHYFGSWGPNRNEGAPILSLKRPWTRGLIWPPKGAARITVSPLPEMNDVTRYPSKEWGYSGGWGQYYAAAGWRGELRPMWRPTAQPGLWFHGGNLQQSRHFSRYLALQLKARHRVPEAIGRTRCQRCSAPRSCPGSE